MSEIFKKLTKGVTQTGSKVKNVVDVNRLKVKTAQQKKDLEKDYLQIGKMVFKSYQSNDETVAIEGAILDSCKQIAAKQKEINELEAKINNAKNLKECTCGEIVSKETKFCPACGYRFKDTT